MPTFPMLYASCLEKCHGTNWHAMLMTVFVLHADTMEMGVKARIGKLHCSLFLGKVDGLARTRCRL